MGKGQKKDKEPKVVTRVVIDDGDRIKSIDSTVEGGSVNIVGGDMTVVTHRR